ncbi:MAG: ATP-dependent DNA ligase, partial [Candidatus Aenigmarchaeota archaeon]|nr:ATP-dependent DNA ligase [Candidatus Aenigmarchaeota archaeon]
KKHISARECIVEGEMLGINRKTGKPMPFQSLSQRIKRKYDIDKMQKEIPVQVNLFDITYLNGKQLFDTPLEKRIEELKKIIKPSAGKFQIARALITKDLKKAKAFYDEALKANQEGLIVKNLDAKYQPGRRVGYWLKVKPTLENLDLVITGAQWGRGKRAGWLGSFILACRDPHTGEFLECGMMGTGIKEKIVSRPKQGKTRDISASRAKGEMQKNKLEDITFRELSSMLKPHITKEKAGMVKIKPSIVIEVSYEEIQKSPNYSSGYALRFPRFISLGTEKPEADSLDRLEKIYRMQKGLRGA